MTTRSLRLDELGQLSKRLTSDAKAYEYLEHLRWRGRPACPHCGVVASHAFLRPANGLSRTTSRGRQSERRVWRCRACGRQFSVITGTVMHGTHLPVRTWILVAYELAAQRRELSVREVEHRYELSSNSASFLLRRLREDLAAPPATSLFGHLVSAEDLVDAQSPARGVHRGGQRLA